MKIKIKKEKIEIVTQTIDLIMDNFDKLQRIIDDEKWDIVYQIISDIYDKGTQLEIKEFNEFLEAIKYSVETIIEYPDFKSIKFFLLSAIEILKEMGQHLLSGLENMEISGEEVILDIGEVNYKDLLFSLYEIKADLDFYKKEHGIETEEDKSTDTLDKIEDSLEDIKYKEVIDTYGYILLKQSEIDELIKEWKKLKKEGYFDKLKAEENKRVEVKNSLPDKLYRIEEFIYLSEMDSILKNFEGLSEDLEIITPLLNKDKIESLKTILYKIIELLQKDKNFFEKNKLLMSIYLYTLESFVKEEADLGIDELNTIIDSNIYLDTLENLNSDIVSKLISLFNNILEKKLEYITENENDKKIFSKNIKHIQRVLNVYINLAIRISHALLSDKLSSAITIIKYIESTENEEERLLFIQEINEIIEWIKQNADRRKYPKIPDILKQKELDLKNFYSIIYNKFDIEKEKISKVWFKLIEISRKINDEKINLELNLVINTLKNIYLEINLVPINILQTMILSETIHENINLEVEKSDLIPIDFINYLEELIKIIKIIVNNLSVNKITISSKKLSSQEYLIEIKFDTNIEDILSKIKVKDYISFEKNQINLKLIQEFNIINGLKIKVKDNEYLVESENLVEIIDFDKKKIEEINKKRFIILGTDTYYLIELDDLENSKKLILLKNKDKYTAIAVSDVISNVSFIKKPLSEPVYIESLKLSSIGYIPYDKPLFVIDLN